MTQEQPQALHLLLVEDSPRMAESLIDLIRSSPISTDIRIVDSEQEALQLVMQLEVDLMIVDLRLRKGNGFSVLKKLQKQDRKPIVIVLSNYSLPKYRELAMLLGAHKFLDKATEFQKLTAILESLAPERLNSDGALSRGNALQS